MVQIDEQLYLSLSDSERQVIDFIYDNADRLMDMSITNIATRTYTSPATVSRAIRKCGFQSISELRYKIANREVSPDESYKVNDIVAKSYRECTTTLDNISIPSILKITDYMQAARRIFLYARGYTALVAEEFLMHLTYLGYNAIVIKDSVMMEWSDKLLTPEDVIIIISVRNTTPELAMSAQIARKIGTKVITLCCMPGTSLEKYSDVYIIGYSETIVNSNSMFTYSRIPLMIMIRIITEYLEKKGEKLPPVTEVDLPYHLEPDHYEAEERKSESGRDAAY